jgi:hypothetical protein
MLRNRPSTVKKREVPKSDRRFLLAGGSPDELDPDAEIQRRGGRA